MIMVIICHGHLSSHIGAMSGDFENYDEEFGGPGSGRFENHESPSVDGLKRWKQVRIMLDVSGRFRYILVLKNKEENKQVIPQAASLLQAAGAQSDGSQNSCCGCCCIWFLAGYGALKELKSPTKGKR